MKLLLLGATGHMGTALEKVCAREGIAVLPCRGGITSLQSLEEQVDSWRPDAVVNMAVMQGVAPCEEKPEAAFRVNALAVFHLAQLCQKCETTLVQASTHAVFDGTQPMYAEHDVPNPTSVYGVTKYAAERFALNLCARHYVVRLPMLFGPTRSTHQGFVDKMVERIKNDEELRVATDKTDSPTYTVDAAQAVIGLVKNGWPYGLYHIANAGVPSYYLLVGELSRLMGKSDDWRSTHLRQALDRDFPSVGRKPLWGALESEKMPRLRPWHEALNQYVDEEVL